jgi:GNAT superfamily N-acetyltransferase
MLDRAHRALRRFGVGGAARKLTSLAGRSLSRLVHVRERHFWYALDLTAPLSQLVCPPGFDLLQATADDLALLEELPTIGAYEARERRAAGADLWLMREGAHTAFACWIFRDRTPVFAVRRGWLSLPPDTVCLEDSVTSPAYRGRGLAGAAWSEIAHILHGQHVAAMITKVAEDNTASRRAVEKAGFLPVAMMTLTRWGLRSRVELQPLRIDHLTTFLEAALSR